MNQSLVRLFKARMLFNLVYDDGLNQQNSFPFLTFDYINLYKKVFFDVILRPLC
jgi:hypothetical protein